MTNPKKLGDSYDCCNQCDKQPGCVAFVQSGSSPADETCRLLRKVYSLDKTRLSLIHNHYFYSTVFMETRAAPNWGKCGDKTGFQGCTRGFYCQPWEPNYYQCVTHPAPQCQVETNVNFYGGDIKSVKSLSPGTCCDECRKTDGCVAYTFVNDTPEGPQCYIKNDPSDRQIKIGAISAYVSK